MGYISLKKNTELRSQQSYIISKYEYYVDTLENNYLIGRQALISISILII